MKGGVSECDHWNIEEYSHFLDIFRLTTLLTFNKKATQFKLFTLLGSPIDIDSFLQLQMGTTQQEAYRHPVIE